MKYINYELDPKAEKGPFLAEHLQDVDEDLQTLYTITADQGNALNTWASETSDLTGVVKEQKAWIEEHQKKSTRHSIYFGMLLAVLVLDQFVLISLILRGM